MNGGEPMVARRGREEDAADDMCSTSAACCVKLIEEDPLMDSLL